MNDLKQAFVIMVGNRFFHSFSYKRIVTAWSLAGAKLFQVVHDDAATEVEAMLKKKGYIPIRKVVQLIEQTPPKFPIKFQLADPDCTWKAMQYPKLRSFGVTVSCKKCEIFLYHRVLGLPINCAQLPFDPEHYVPHYDHKIRKVTCDHCDGAELEYFIVTTDDLPF